MSVSTSPDIDDARTARLEDLARALKKREADEAADRQAAREAIITVVSQAKDPIEAPLDRVADEEGVTVEQAQLALASLLADGTVRFTDDYKLSVVK